ncbi:type II toxin-antitoxin system RelE/ParE family toxin [Candidatus Woesearchaeota archaeon]|nr:type II toxin-antitoxin system RelE/ParE family toxin [Candidatus Woesearchaeota archaeon]
MNNKPINVSFVSQKLKSHFNTLKSGKFEDKRLFDFIDRAIDDLKKNPICGTKIKKMLWPKEYKQKYSINNLWKYDLPNAWRIIYTIETDEVTIVSIILEWFSHKEYEKRFNYL